MYFMLYTVLESYDYIRHQIWYDKSYHTELKIDLFSTNCDIFNRVLIHTSHSSNYGHPQRYDTTIIHTLVYKDLNM